MMIVLFSPVRPTSAAAHRSALLRRGLLLLGHQTVVIATDAPAAGDEVDGLGSVVQLRRGRVLHGILAEADVVVHVVGADDPALDAAAVKAVWRHPGLLDLSGALDRSGSIDAVGPVAALLRAAEGVLVDDASAAAAAMAVTGAPVHATEPAGRTGDAAAGGRAARLLALAADADRARPQLSVLRSGAAALAAWGVPADSPVHAALVDHSAFFAAAENA